MAQALLPMTAGRIRTACDGAGFEVGATIRVRWSDPTTQGILTDQGVILTRNGSLANGDLSLIIQYSFGQYPLPPTDGSVTIYTVDLVAGVASGMGAARRRLVEGGGALEISPTNPRTWSVFIHPPSQMDTETLRVWRQKAVQDFTVWLRLHHGIPNPDRLSACPPTGPWPTVFDYHRHNGILRAITLWVKVAQRMPEWQEESNLELAEELIAEAETHLHRDNARRIHEALAAGEASGRIGKAIARARGKKSGGDAEDK